MAFVTPTTPNLRGPRGPYKIQAPIDRFMRKVLVAPGGCWEWQGVKWPNGYGQFGVRYDGFLAHRWSYEHHVGKIPDGLDIDHLCRNRGCVNPEHLEPVTRQENLRRGINPRREQTHCVNGHAFDSENTRARGSHRVCRTCNSERSRAWKLSRRSG